VPTRIIFLNKLDRPGASFKYSVSSLLSHQLHPRPVVLTLPIASFDPSHYSHAEPGIQGLVDLVKWELWKWSPDGECTQYALPRDVKELAEMDAIPSSHPILAHLAPARTALLENLSMTSESLMKSLLELPSDPSAYLNISTSVVLPHLRSATLSNDILPVLCGSALKNIGTAIVMDYIGELLSSPVDVRNKVLPHNPLVHLLAWKVSWDSRRGWMTFVRVYSGGQFKKCLNLVSHCSYQGH
jgi:elongation factor G